MVPAHSIGAKTSYVENIASICSEKLVYEFLFTDLFPDGYNKNNAEDFLKFSRSGWSKECFNFFILSSDEQIVGCISIKNIDRNAGEVGYWVSSKHSGLATNALTQLCIIAKELGFKRLFAQTKVGNDRSNRVLENNQFHKDDSFLIDKKCARAFVKEL